MYGFNIVQDEGAWRLELEGINMLVEGYTVENEKHLITNPKKAIAFFNINGNLYGVSNNPVTFYTAEDFYDTMRNQYMIFKGKKATTINNNLPVENLKLTA